MIGVLAALGVIQADLAANRIRREAERLAAWKAEYDKAPHEQRMEMIELEKLRAIREQTEVIRSKQATVNVHNHTTEMIF